MTHYRIYVKKNGLLGKHHIRANFYHIVSLIFLFVTGLYMFDVISEKTSFIITSILFVADYVAEMYDPNPDNPGPWFRRHFHRAFENGE